MISDFDVLGIGNAIVDVIAHSSEEFLVKEQIKKGSMTLIDEDRALHLFDKMGPATIISGGSGANTVVGAASFGVRAAYIGKVKNDETGKLFSRDIRSMDVHFPTSAAEDGPSTARCYVLVTPDSERTMSTYLGACQNLVPADVSRDLVESSAITYLEGYLWDPPAAKEAFLKASSVAHAAKRRVALTLSDSFCVDRYRDEFLHLIRSRAVDIVFANQLEIKSLYQTSDFNIALAALRNENLLGVVTCSAEGSIIVTQAAVESVPAFAVGQVVDTTGAGDLFAAGFLAGLAKQRDHSTCARLGALAAAEVIQHLGARSSVNLKKLASENGLSI
jgi:sugar/nucleoside kinase (ribokinase family)